MSSSSPITANQITIFEKQGFVDSYKSSNFGRAHQQGVIDQTESVTGQNRGNTVSIWKTKILTGQGVGSDTAIIGNEEALLDTNQSMTIDEFSHAVLNPTALKSEYWSSNIPFEETAAKLLPGYLMSRKEASFMQQAAGAYSTTITVDGTTYSGNNRAFVTGFNTVTAPATSRTVRAGGAANDQSITSADTLTLSMINDAIEIANTTQPIIQTLPGGVLNLYLSMKGYTQLLEDTNSPNQLFPIAIAETQGGDKNNKIIKGNGYAVDYNEPVARYRNVNIYISHRVAKGLNSGTSAVITTVERAVLCGANALYYGSHFGSIAKGNVPFKMSAELQDYGRFKGMSITSLDGMVKNLFDPGSGSTDAAIITLPHYAA